MSTTHHAPCKDGLSDGFDVLDVCHRRILFTLGKLSALISRLQTFGADAEARAMAREVLTFFTTAVRHHHEDEERHVFPRLLDEDDQHLTAAVLRLQRDHDWLEEDWLELEPHLAALAAGQSWYDVDVLREGCAAFTALMHDHIALEESVVYPQVRSTLQERERRDMGREMAARRRSHAEP